VVFKFTSSKSFTITNYNFIYKILETHKHFRPYAPFEKSHKTLSFLGVLEKPQKTFNSNKDLEKNIKTISKYLVQKKTYKI